MARQNLEKWGRSKARERYAEGGVTVRAKDASGKSDRLMPGKIGDRFGGADLPLYPKGSNQREYYDSGRPDVPIIPPIK